MNRGTTGFGMALLCATATMAAVTDEQVQRVHRRAIVVDTHADTLWRVLDKGDDITPSGCSRPTVRTTRRAVRCVSSTRCTRSSQRAPTE